MTFGEKIVLLRKAKGMSQDQLAERLGVTRQSVSKWERDEVIADTDRVLALSRLFGVSCDYLLDNSITDAAQPAPPKQNSATVPPLGKPTTRIYWHWLGLIPLLWGLGDLLVIRYLFTGWFGIRIADFGALLRMIPQMLKYYPQGSLILVFCLLALLIMMAKIAVGLFLIIRGCKRNAKIARESQRETPLE